MEQKKFLAAIKQIAAERGISEELIKDAVKSAFATAYKKDFAPGNKDIEIKVELNEDALELAKIYVLKEVVEDGDVLDANIEIAETEAKRHDRDAEIGDEIYIECTPEGYGRIAAQSAKQVILQKIQEASRKSLFEKFKDKEGTSVIGSINRIEGNKIFIDVEKTTIEMKDRNSIRTERYFPGKRMWFYVDKVNISAKGPQIILSRTHKNLVTEIIKEEIPEVKNGEVEIIAVARDPGFRSKVAVKAGIEGIDPVGACIGQRGARIQPIMEEFNGERIDVIEYSADPLQFVARALQPAKIDTMVVVNDQDFSDIESGRVVKKRIAVFVDEEARAMAIGKKGQNIRLASDLTGFEIDMYNLEEYEPFMERLKTMKN